MGIVGLKAQQEEQKEQQKAALNETRREAVSKYNELVVKHNKVVERNKELREVIKDFQEIPIIERCLAIIRSFVFHINGHFDADDRRLLSFVMQGNEDAAESLRRAAFQYGRSDMPVSIWQQMGPGGKGIKKYRQRSKGGKATTK